MIRIDDYEQLTTRIVNWLKDYYWMHSGNIKAFVVGVSGGIDSAVVSTLCAKTELPTYVLTMPLHSKEENTELSELHAYGLVEKYSNVTLVNVDLSETYDKFMRGEMNVPGNDFCDMATADGNTKSLDEMIMVNAMLPRVYYSQWQNNIYERKSRALMKRLFPLKNMNIDYDQLLAKRPNQKDAIFAFHQDTAYWPDLQGRDPSTATCSLAIDPTTIPNGCIAFLPKSHNEIKLRELYNYKYIF